MAKATVKQSKIDALTPDGQNANKGTQRGRSALEASLRKLGAGRSILIDRSGRIIAGSKTAETAADIGLDDVLIVQTDGKQLVAVQRTDIDLDTPQGREMAYADNRVGQLDLDFDIEQILADVDGGLDLSFLWYGNELEDLSEADARTELSAPSQYAGRIGESAQQVRIVLSAVNVEPLERAIRATGERNRANAVMEICRHYLETNAKGQFYTAIEGVTSAKIA